MSEISNRTYKELAVPYFLEVFLIVDEVLKKHKSPYYLIGVTAADIQLLKDGFKPARGTKDIDFAVMVSTFIEYDKIKVSLIEKGFNQVKVPFTLYHPKYDVVIDLLPFGEIEQSDTINFTEREITMNVLGFKEILEQSTEVSLDNALSIQVPPLHGMVILKLIAWSDRPEIRVTDLEDIYRIIKHYYDITGEAVFDEHYDLLAIDPFDEKSIAAQIMGRKISEILNKSGKLKNAVMKVIDENTSDPAKSSIGKHWASKYGVDVEYAMNLLVRLKAGILEKSN
jgi:predicted nucleotidyltransferase